jgi:hypothetical protein
MLEKPACHDVWQQHLCSDALEMSNLTRAIKVGCGFVLKLVDAPVQVVFKGCDHDPSSPDESWKAEVLAHAVDRLFHIHRTPVVCARALVARQGSTMAFIPAAVHVPEREWAAPAPAEAVGVPMCNRSVDSPRFVCRRLGKVTTERSIRSLIASACLFSRPLAVRIVEVHRSGRPAQLLRQVLDARWSQRFRRRR